MREPLDVARYIFMNDENELRSGWRVLAFLLFFFVAASLLTGSLYVIESLFPSINYLTVDPSGPEYLSRHEVVFLIVRNVINLLAALIATAISAPLFERRSFASIGYMFHRGWLNDFSLGTAMGASALAVAVGIAAVAHTVTFDVRRTGEIGFARGLVISLIFFVVAAASEELLFRGFPFQALVHNLGGVAAIGTTSLIFGLAHLANPSATFYSVLNTILAGVWLGIAYLKTRSLWFATALHFSWNFAMVFIFGLPVSGFTNLEQAAWLRGHSGTPAWISGGDYGPEGGVAATIALIISTLLIWKSGLFNPSEEMLAAIQHGKREPALISVIPDRLARDEGEPGQDLNQK